MPQNPPAGWPKMSSAVFYQDPAAALEWLEKAFGFTLRVKIEAPDGSIAHSEMECDSGVVMVAGENESWKSPKTLGGRSTQSVYVYVDDIDAHCEKARAAGAKIVRELQTMDYGDRTYGCEDPEGHQWFFGQRVDDAAWEAATKGQG